MSTESDSIVIAPPGTPKASIIWLHGLGADGHDFEPLVNQMRLADAGIRVTLPHAPRRPVTINGGYVMRAWYDILDINLAQNPDEFGIHESSALLTRLAQAEEDAGIPTERIVLAGFSQGGAIALHCGLRFPRRLAGILALSTYLPLSQALDDEAAEANHTTPIFMGHGQMDPIVPLHQGQASATRLADMGYPVEFRQYAMPHSVCPQEVLDIGAWLSKVFTSQSS